MKLVLNRQFVETDLNPGTKVLDFVRGPRNLSSVKSGCREGDCGACTLLVGERVGQVIRYDAVCSCLLPLGAVEGRHLVTLEGLLSAGVSVVQRAIIENGASQCGFCTPGVVVSLVGFLISSPVVDGENAFRALAGNLCRCTGYASIKRAARSLARRFSALPRPGDGRIERLVAEEILPGYFLEIPERLDSLRARSRRYKRGSLIVAGGTDLSVQKPRELLDRELHLLGESGLADIWEDAGGLHIGAMATVETICRSELVGHYIRGISRIADLIASAQIRHRATLGGNIVNASPIGDMTVVMIAMDARLRLRHGRKRRTTPLASLFKGYKELDLHEGEIVERIDIPRRNPTPAFHFEKVAKRVHLDIASVNTAVALTTKGERIEHVRIAAGGVAPVPLYLSRTCAALTGQRVTWENVQRAARIAESEISPIGDVRGSASYKRLLLPRLIFAHFNALVGIQGELR